VKAELYRKILKNPKTLSTKKRSAQLAIGMGDSMEIGSQEFSNIVSKNTVNVKYKKNMENLE
jgi:hypothetical protein